MSPVTKQLLVRALSEAVPLVANASQVAPDHVRQWTRDGNGWSSRIRLQPDLFDTYVNCEEEVLALFGPFLQAVLSEYPELGGQVGLAGIEMRSFGKHDFSLPENILAFVLAKSGTFDLTSDQIVPLADDLQRYLECENVEFVYRSQLIGFRFDGDSIHLPGNVVIRRMNDEEFTLASRFNDPVSFTNPINKGIDEFCIEGHVSVPKRFGEILKNDPIRPRRIARSSFDNALLWLRSFKRGSVGYLSIYFYPQTFSPTTIYPSVTSNFTTLWDIYSLGSHQVDELVEHASLLSSAHDSAMAGACSRLADSETRVNATDQILDAVIGMEAILLAGLGDQKGELRYRFSINYSTLFDTPQSKLEGFRVAKKLYDLRCVVAHGDTIDSKQCRLGDKVLSLGEWGRLASDTLRSLVKKFLPADPKKSYKNSDFWEEAYFGIR